tara:strand:- start:607 stop:810 length:204 start_codon:yes stop_codon:yes gene_type:complete
MSNINEGNVFNVETSEISSNRSDELTDVKKTMMDKFWASMARQGISSKQAKEIIAATFPKDQNIPKD